MTPYELRYKHEDGTTVECMITASSWEEVKERLKDITEIFLRDIDSPPVPEGTSRVLRLGEGSLGSGTLG